MICVVCSADDSDAENSDGENKGEKPAASTGEAHKKDDSVGYVKRANSTGSATASDVRTCTLAYCNKSKMHMPV
jgi:hypothetical protein